MTEEERYLFDLRGFLVVKNALTPAQVADLSERLQEHRNESQRLSGSDRSRYPGGESAAFSAKSLIEWGGTYVDLIDLPAIVPYLKTLIGTNYRLDHDYIKIDNAAHATKLYLHGGGQGAGGATDLVGPTDGGQCYYRYNNGKFYNGLVAVGFELDTVPPGAGGFACVPGSHKVNFQLPSDWKVSETQEDLPEFVHRVGAEAGDAIIFTEACAHGTVPWEGRRRATDDLLQVLPARGGVEPLLLQRRRLREAERPAARHADATERIRLPRLQPQGLGEGAGGTGRTRATAQKQARLGRRVSAAQVP